ncbi:MAG: hypothetical protein ACTSRS_00425 [Candidatus Helarchaeota archaeon]
MTISTLNSNMEQSLATSQNSMTTNSGISVTHPPNVELLANDPTNHTISWTLFEPLDYSGEYSFTNDKNGMKPAGWNYYNYSNTNVKIIDTFKGHHKVVEFWDNSTLTDIGHTNITQYLFPGHSTGAIEFWLYGIEGSTNDDLFFIEFQQGDLIWAFKLVANWQSAEDKLDNNMVSNIIAPGDFPSDMWHHLRVEWNCSAQTFKVWHNSLYKGEFSFWNYGGNAMTIDKISFGTSGIYSAGNFYAYLDAIDYSWSTGYLTNRNMNYTIPPPEPCDYLGAFSFTNDTPGTDPTGFTVYEYPNTNTNVVESFEGHHKVVELWDNVQLDTVGHTNLSQSLSPSQSTGTIEFWIYGIESSINDRSITTIHFMDDTIYAFELYINWDSDYQMIDNYMVENIIPIGGFQNNAWQHLRIEWNCTAAKFKVWHNSSYIGEFNFWNFGGSALSINTINFATSGLYSTGNFKCYLDAIDYSWTTGYYLNRNMNYSAQPLLYTIFIDDIQKIGWSEWTSQLQINFTINALNLGVGIHNVSIVYNDRNGQWYHDDVEVKVNPAVTASWEVPSNIKVEIEIGRDRVCDVSFTFKNTGNATLTNLNFTVVTLPGDWITNPVFRVYTNLTPGNHITVSFQITVAPSDREFFEVISINFAATILETSQPVSDLIHVMISGIKVKNITLWVILIVGSIAAVATTSFYVIRRRRTPLPQSKSKSIGKTRSTIKKGLFKDFPKTYSVLSSELIEKINTLKNLTDSERAQLIEYLNQLDEDEALQFLNYLKLHYN